MDNENTVNGIHIPTPATLRRYGLSEDDWVALGEEQGWVCGACLPRHVPNTNRFVIDHEHVRNWKKMPPAERKKYVRGLICWSANHYRLARGATPENLRGAADYLERYARRRAEDDS